MKKETKKRSKVFLIIFISVFIVLILISTVSAGWFDWLRKTITGKDVKEVTMNISIGGPEINEVFNETMTSVSGGLTAGPSMTNIIINFSVNIASGVANLDNATATINFSKTGYTTRENASCHQIDGSGNLANYTCEIAMWWWDGSGAWSITAFIQDTNANTGVNSTTNFSVGSTIGFDIGPSALNWSGISPGATNQTSNTDPILMNNTGNNNITATKIEVNSTDLLGETTSTQALWASNFSVSPDTGGAACSGAECLECGETNMVNESSTGIEVANLSADNFTINDNSTGQEELYFCIRTVGDLSTQYYSTVGTAPWTIKISI